MQQKVALGEITAVSTAITDGPWLQTGDGGLTLRYEFDRDELLYHGGVAFHGVRAFRKRAESLCTPWHIEGAYDTVAEVRDSEWVAELSAVRPDQAARFPMTHYMLYLDSYGCLEVVAAQWSLLPDDSAENLTD